MPRILFRFLVAGAAVCALAFPAVATADITRFDLSGIVTDGTGGVLPGVTVTLKNVDTGFTRSTVTDSDGRYSFNAVPPTGKWTLTAELPGFGTQNREGLEFQANTRPEINFQLNVGGVQESITVAAASPLVRTRESELSSILDAKQVDALPTNGRNFLSLLQTSGSVVPTGGGSSAPVGERAGHAHGQLRRRRRVDDRPRDPHRQRRVRRRQRPLARRRQGTAGHHQRLQGRDRPDRRRHDQRRDQERNEHACRQRLRILAPDRPGWPPTC